MFIGPSGTGKTELAKTLAHTLSGTNPASDIAPEPLIKLDMSEFSESHSIARLIGAPPGYVGHEESGFLTDKIRRNPYSVILFDEIEKAHPKIFNILLQILEDGVLTDSQGRTADLKNSFVILTSNIGSAQFSKNNELGFSSGSDMGKRNDNNALGMLKDFIKPEILNRMDDIIVFKDLDNTTLEKITKAQIDSLVKRMAANSVSVKISPAVSKWLVQNTENRQKNARAIRKAVEMHIEEPLAELVLQEKTEIKIKTSNGKLVLESN
ncbi:MAG: AAA family ATPase [Candidatus Spechtbacterales bacterium]